MKETQEQPECPQCGGEKNNPCFLWTQTTGWGDVECGPKCANIFHNAPTRREGHSALRVNNGKLETFDPHPTPPASQPTITLDRETWRRLRDAWFTRSVNYEHECVTLDFGAAEEIDALLRAAERRP